MAVGLQHLGVLRLGHLVLGIQQLEHTGRTGQCVLQLSDHAGDLVEGLGVLVGIVQEDAQLADGDAARHSVNGTHQTDTCINDVVHKAGSGVGHAGEEDGLQAHALQAAIHLIKGGKALGLMAKGLHDLLALDHLVDQGSLLTAHGALALEILIAALGKEACHNQAQRGDADHHQRDGHILTEHKQQGAKDGQHAAEQLGKAHEQAVRKGVHIGDHAADDIAGGVAVQIRERQGLDLTERGVAQVPADREGDAVVADTQQPLGKCSHHGHDYDLHHDAQNTVEVHIPLAQHHINGAAAEDGNIQLGSHAHSGHDQTANHKKAVRADLFQHPPKRCVALFRGQLTLCFCTHFCASPFLNWLA